MKRFIALFLAMVCVMCMVGCSDNQQSISEEEKNQLIYGEPQEPSDNDVINYEGKPLNIEGISQEKVEEIALAKCKVNYDYIKTEFNYNEKQWSVEFWENVGKKPTVTILIDTKGNVISILYAE